MRKTLLALFVVLAIATPKFAKAGDMDYAAIYEKASKSVVFIVAMLNANMSKTGSGFVISPDGYVMTSRHVIWDDQANKCAAKLLIFLKPDRITGRSEDDLIRRYDATLIREKKELDLALLKIEGVPAGLVPFVFADEEAAKVGMPTAAIGHPEGGARWSLTTGQISGQQLDFAGVKGFDMIQMTTPLNPGNSGGPLLNKDSKIVGVNTAVIRKGSTGVVLEGINLALKGTTAYHWLKETPPPGLDKVSEVVAKQPEPKPTPPAQKEKLEKVQPGHVFTPKDIEEALTEIEDEGEKAVEEFMKGRKK